MPTERPFEGIVEDEEREVRARAGRAELPFETASTASGRTSAAGFFSTLPGRLRDFLSPPAGEEQDVPFESADSPAPDNRGLFSRLAGFASSLRGASPEARRAAPAKKSKPQESEPQEPGPARFRKSSFESNSSAMFEVNDVVELTGFGWYQHKVLLVMGIMEFADAAEIWLATIILNNLKCEWGLSSLEKALIPAIVYLFYAIGSIISGKLADKFGRFPVMLVNSYVLVVSAVCSALAPSYYFFLVCRAITGFCIGGNTGTSLVYAAEVVPANMRSWNMCILGTYWTCGSVYECLVAFFVMDLEYGWRIQILLTALPCLIMLVFLHFVDESPRWLTIHNEQEKAMAVVGRMCRDNHVTLPTGTLFCSDVRSGEYGEIWAAPHTKGSVEITIHFVCNMFLVFGISMLIADMMYYNYCYMDMFFDSTYVDSKGCTVYTKAEYLFLLVVALSFAPGMLLGSAGAETIGRRWTFILSIYSGTAFTVLLLFCLDSVLTYVELFGCVLAYSTYNEVLWIYGPEFYPTYMRATAVGVQNGIGKLGAAAGTFLTEYMDEYNIVYTLYCFTAVTVVASITVLFMDRETKGQLLVDTRTNEQTPINATA